MLLVCTGWSKSLFAPDDYSTKTRKERWQSQNTFGMWIVLYWTLSSRTQFGVSINVWRLAGDTLIITCNFLYCNHQVHRDFLITMYYCYMSKIGYEIIIFLLFFKILDNLSSGRWMYVRKGVRIRDCFSKSNGVCEHKRLGNTDVDVIMLSLTFVWRGVRKYPTHAI
jgi:hypothetical protein